MFSIFNVNALHSGTFCVIVILDVMNQSSFSYQVHCSNDKCKNGKFSVNINVTLKMKYEDELYGQYCFLNFDRLYNVQFIPHVLLMSQFGSFN